MSYICYECARKISKSREEAVEEIRRRQDGGERLEDLCVEYENEAHKLLKANLSGTERYLFLEEAIDWCRFCLSCSRLHKAGWTTNHSGEWVRKNAQNVKFELTEALEYAAALEKWTKLPWLKRIRTPKPTRAAKE